MKLIHLRTLSKVHVRIMCTGQVGCKRLVKSNANGWSSECNYTGSAAIIEIKHPGMKLLAKKAYRDGVHGPSKDLGGAISQSLSQRASLQANIRNLTDRLDDDVHIRSYAVPIVIVAGLTPESKAEQRSLEHLRHSMKDVQIITFDELQGRLETIHRALRPDEDDALTSPA